MNNVGHKPSSSKLHQFQCWKENSWYGDSHTKSIFFTCRMMIWKDQAPELHSSHVRFGKKKWCKTFVPANFNSYWRIF
jgi:hypothetical protein